MAPTLTSLPSARSGSGSPSSPDGLYLKLVLASGSPQRREILQKLGLEFEVMVPGVEELTEGDPGQLVRANALRKSRAASGAGMPARGVVLDMPAPHPELVV